MEACRVGWRKPLGHDMLRRRYWALGAGTACWRVYVEEQEGALWGWYEGGYLCKHRSIIALSKAVCTACRAGMVMSTMCCMYCAEPGGQ